jgi:hypothetical protein
MPVEILIKIIKYISIFFERYLTFSKSCLYDFKQWQLDDQAWELTEEANL